MKSNILITIFLFFFSLDLFAENLNIESKNITLDKDQETSIFEGGVVIKTKDNNIIKSEFAEYNKKKQFIILKKNIFVIDGKNNQIKADYAEYKVDNQLFKTRGPSEITTTQNYLIKGEDIVFDNRKKYIKSDKKTIINDIDNNEITLEKFEYLIKDNVFRSVGSIKIIDKLNNSYEFSQIYIDTKKKEIIGSDIKAYINQEDFKIDKRNKPRIFANTININKKKSSFNKSIFTLCDYRPDDKCPPWTIQSSKMEHDSLKKTIYYDNAVIKVYDFPIFYFPKLAHPDPTVDRRSGFLPPTLSDSKNLGSGISIPYFLAINNDKNFTLTSKLYHSENPLFLGEYHQAFKNSYLLADFGYTEGYKKNTKTKKAGEKSHFFSKFIKNFSNESSESTLSLSVQDVSNDKYLKLYKIKSNLVDYNNETLESSLNFTHEKEDIFFGLNASVYETLKSDYNDKYEYIFPEITLDKNLFSNSSFGNLDLQSNLKMHNYDTNKLTTFLVNDFNWDIKDIYFKSGLSGKLTANLKNINYEAKNVSPYKDTPTSEFYGALGYLSSIELQKKISNNSVHLFKPKFFVRYAPGNMRIENSGSRLSPIKAFGLNRLDNSNNFESGLSATLGFDYELEKNNKNFDFSLAQVINEKENKKMPTVTGLDEKLSDIVGSANLKINNKFNLNYNFALDQNYEDLNYNEIGTSVNLNALALNLNYLQEKKHIGDQEYFKTKLNLKNTENSSFVFETKRNLVTNSSEFYNLSYEYTNDCLKAGLVYRREFYSDSELEPENSLMFQITLTPFGNINSPSFNK